MIASMTYAGRRIGRRDIVIAAVISLLGLVLMVANVQRLTDAIPPTAEEQPNIELGGLLPIGFAIPLFLLVTVPLAWRRVAPLGATGAALAGLVLNFVLIGSDPLRCGIVLPTAFLFVFASAQMEKREALVGFVFGLGLTLLDLVVEFGGLTLAVATGLTVLIWAVGRLVRSRRQMAAELTARTVELREARDARARLEVFSDRARLSRDLDELLERRLGELARMADTDRPGDVAGATATLVDIERESRRTLEEMRAIVGMLRDDSVAPTGPPPAITHLDALLVRATGSSSARLTFEGNPRVLPPAVELSAYRIVEHLLAALEVTPDVQVHICFGDEVLTLAVSGCARRRGKAAIERARERARVQHGTLKVSAHGGRADATVSLPVAAPA
ncbi:MAG: hypothetical protein QOH61_2787 [Chloroflexota bacterium]|jgi:hypothetical protein|nr:hypothetical protein [Chloroflexota bacterium]